MLAEDPSDAGTFLDLDGDFTPDTSDPGTFNVTRRRSSVQTDGGLAGDGFKDRGFVVGVDLPLTVNDGPMTVDVAVF